MLRASHFLISKNILLIKKILLKSARRVPRGPVDLCFGTTEGHFSVLRNRTHTAVQYGFGKCFTLPDSKKDILIIKKILSKSARRCTRSGGPWLCTDRSKAEKDRNEKHIRVQNWARIIKGGYPDWISSFY